MDADRIALWGGSYGGYLTALGLRAPRPLRRRRGLPRRPRLERRHHELRASYDPAKRQDVARLAFDSSPMASVKTWRSPVLLIHGDDDRNVPFSQSVDLAQALRQKGIAFEELIFPDEIHDFLIHAHWIAAYHAAEDFLGRRLKK